MSPKRSSLRSRLMLAVTSVLAFSLFGFSLVLHASFARALWSQFDGRLAEDARAVANSVEEQSEEPWEFEAGIQDDYELDRHDAAYYEVWMDDGSVLARSPSLKTEDLPAPVAVEGSSVTKLTLPDGRAGRVFVGSFLPRPVEEEAAAPALRRITVAVARSTAEIDRTLAILRLLLWGSALTTLALAAVAATLAVRRGLSPVAQLSARVDAIDAQRLGERLPTEDLPAELRPPVEKLNELLARLEQAFDRERQFSSDVSHELRTPLAGLRSVLEVASSRARPAAEYRESMRQALQIVVQLGRMVESLLMLARLDAHQEAIARQDVDLHALVDEVLARHAASAASRALRLANDVPPVARITSDRGKLHMVASNLIGNAVAYTEEGGEVKVRSDLSRGIVLEVYDSGPALPASALESVFDRFVRLEPSRSHSDEHSGVGLALVRGLCTALGLRVVAQNLSGGGVAFTVSVQA